MEPTSRSTPPRMLRAGALTAELEAGNLRYIRFGGVEMIRAVSYIVARQELGHLQSRDQQAPKSTRTPTASALPTTLSPRTQCRNSRTAPRSSGAPMECCASPRAERRRRISSPTALASSCCTRSRMSPARPRESATRAARASTREFPELIDPVQPMMNLRAITPRSSRRAPHVECGMEGDTFEMEDQRNWTDASYKTYVRPLALPWPYTLAKGDELEQSVTLTVSGALPPHARGGEAIHVACRRSTGHSPGSGAWTGS